MVSSLRIGELKNGETRYSQASLSSPTSQSGCCQGPGLPSYREAGSRLRLGELLGSSSMRRMMSTFSCDIAYSDSPAASRAVASSITLSIRTIVSPRKVNNWK